MLKIFTKIDKSSIPNAGLGLFTGQKIKKGDIVWEYNQSTTIYFNNEMLTNMPTVLKNLFMKHGELYKNNRIYYLDDSAFMNHSDNPNVIYSLMFQNDFEKDIKINMIAVKDIEIGEELFYNYYSFDEDAKIKLT